jgi:hypothetical protein
LEILLSPDLHGDQFKGASAGALFGRGARATASTYQGRHAAAGRPAIPGEDGGAVPDGIATAREMYTESQLLRQQLLLQQQAQPPAPAFRRRGYRPLGPGDCMIHASTQRCQRCGATVTPVHIMMRLIGGSFCERCCPARHPEG